MTSVLWWLQFIRRKYIFYTEFKITNAVQSLNYHQASIRCGRVSHSADCERIRLHCGNGSLDTGMETTRTIQLRNLFEINGNCEIIETFVSR